MVYPQKYKNCSTLDQLVGSAAAVHMR
jgi:hypothetical protein